MKTLSLISMIVTFLLMGSTVLCGFWIRSNGADAEGVRFHMLIAVTTVLVASVTMILQYLTARSA